MPNYTTDSSRKGLLFLEKANACPRRETGISLRTLSYTDYSENQGERVCGYTTSCLRANKALYRAVS